MKRRFKKVGRTLVGCSLDEQREALEKESAEQAKDELARRVTEEIRLELQRIADRNRKEALQKAMQQEYIINTPMPIYVDNFDVYQDSVEPFTVTYTAAPTTRLIPRNTPTITGFAQTLTGEIEGPSIREVMAAISRIPASDKGVESQTKKAA